MGRVTPDDRVYQPVNGRRSYGARLLGPDPRAHYEREWCHRRQSLRGQRGLWVEIGPTPGWYEVQTFTQFGAKQRTYYAFAGPGGDVEVSPAPPAQAFAGPLPGKPGCWNSERCRCGAEVEHYTPEGFPVCGDHHEEQETAA